MKRLLATLLLCSHLQTANASVYDKCILDHAANAVTKEAVYNVRDACLSSSETRISSSFGTALPPPKMSAYLRDRTQFESGEGYVLEGKIYNDTIYDITAYIIVLIDRKTQATYSVTTRDFNEPIPPGVISSGPPLSGPINMIRAGSDGYVRFYLPYIKPLNPKTFFKDFIWAPVPEFGIAR